MVGVIGINHVQSSLQSRENIGKVIAAIIKSTPGLFNTPYLLLDTCSRTEWYFFSSDLFATAQLFHSQLKKIIGDQAEKQVYSYFNANCFIHLYLVVSGINSAFFGETEIQGQIKQAYKEAVKNGTITGPLHYLFQKALHAGKILRKELPSSMTAPLQIEQVLIERLKKQEDSSPLFPLLLIGASAINHRVVAALTDRYQSKEIYITNRTMLHGLDFAKKHKIHWMDLSTAQKTWPTFPTVITAIRRNEKQYVIGPESYNSSGEKNVSLIFDLGVPRNVDPMLHQYVPALHNIETLFPKIQPQTQKLAAHCHEIAHKLGHASYIKYLQKIETYCPIVIPEHQQTLDGKKAEYVSHGCLV